MWKRVATVAAALGVFFAGPSDARRPANHTYSNDNNSSTTYSDTGFYTNSRGHSVHRPTNAASAPAGASAHCRDGTWSFSESHRGTCSWHGGVGAWL